MIKTKGYMTLVLLMVLIMVGVSSVAVVHIYSANSMSNMGDFWSKQSFAIATGGQERAAVDLLGMIPDNLSARDNCATVPVNNQVLGDGRYDITTTERGSVTVPANAAPLLTPAAVLSAAINSTDTTIPVTFHPSHNFSDSGRIMIDKEQIDYFGRTANSFTNCIRGVDGTTASSHLATTIVAQKQCDVTTIGGIPDTSTAATGRTQLTQGVQTPEAFLVGYRRNNRLFFGQWDGRSWRRVRPISGDVNRHLRGISIISYADGYAVGDDGSGELIMHWNGRVWARVTTQGSIPNADLNAVHCMNGQNCWAVGDNAGGDFIVHWNGLSWSRFGPYNSGPTAVANRNLYAVHCAQPTQCYAVGQHANNRLNINTWDGFTWQRQTPTGSCDPRRHLRGVWCSSSTRCWAVGNRNACGTALIMEWDGTSWFKTPNMLLTGPQRVPNRTLFAVTCTSDSDCWAVGQRATMVHWDGTIWRRVVPVGVPNNVTFYSVACANANNCWAGGNRRYLMHWNGIRWVRVNQAPLNSNRFTGIGVIAANTHPTSAWREDFA